MRIPLQGKWAITLRHTDWVDAQGFCCVGSTTIYLEVDESFRNPANNYGFTYGTHIPDGKMYDGHRTVVPVRLIGSLNPPTHTGSGTWIELKDEGPVHCGVWVAVQMFETGRLLHNYKFCSSKSWEELMKKGVNE